MDDFSLFQWPLLIPTYRPAEAARRAQPRWRHAGVVLRHELVSWIGVLPLTLSGSKERFLGFLSWTSRGLRRSLIEYSREQRADAMPADGEST